MQGDGGGDLKASPDRRFRAGQGDLDAVHWRRRNLRAARRRPRRQLYLGHRLLAAPSFRSGRRLRPVDGLLERRRGRFGRQREPVSRIGRWIPTSSTCSASSAQTGLASAACNRAAASAGSWPVRGRFVAGDVEPFEHRLHPDVVEDAVGIVAGEQVLEPAAQFVVDQRHEGVAPLPCRNSTITDSCRPSMSA